MQRTFDRIVIAVPDLQAAIDAYTPLLGAPDVVVIADTRARWVLANTVIEITQQPDSAARVAALVFTSADARAVPVTLENSLGLCVQVCDGSAMATLRKTAVERALHVDHLVLRTNDAQACIALFRDRLGVRLALDKTVPDWGGRMLFFRGGKMTLEVIESEDQDANFFWGIAYQCDDIETQIKALSALGVGHSALRDGRKPGTRVASLKSHNLDIPTLLIQPASRT